MKALKTLKTLQILAVTFLLSTLLISNTYGQAHVDTELANEMASNPTAIEVIVTFHGNDAPTAANISLLDAVGITKGLTMNALPIAGIVATPAQINALAADPSVRSLYLNEQLQYDNHEANKLTGVSKARTDATFTANNNGLPLTGNGIGLVVNDSGIDGTHPDLQFGQNLVQNVMASANLNSLNSILPYTPIENVVNTDVTGGHGTHCAGTAAGTGAASQGLYEGSAPGADVIGYGSGAGLFILDVVSAFDWAIVNQIQYNIRVITNSWGTTGDVGTAFDPNDPINISTKKCVDRNIVIVFSAGNSGSSSGTISGNYKKAPWVICVAAGDKQGRLTDFSSRGRDGVSGTVTVGGQTFTWEDRPTVTAPGKEIISARAISPVGLLSTDSDVDLIPPAYLAHYTNLSGTSMATPHVAGIVAMMLEANPTLTPYDVKAILQQTATNIPGRADWEVGAGYVNAYAALHTVYSPSADYGSTLNMNSTFNSNVNTTTSTQNFAVSYSPTGSGNSTTFNIPAGTTSIEAKMETGGALQNTGNTLNLVLFSPSGVRYSAGIPVTFAISYDRGVAVTNPEAGTWTLEVQGLQGVALPEDVSGTIAIKSISSVVGLSDAQGHPAESAILLAASARLMDGQAGQFAPDNNLTRLELAKYLVMGQGVRQYDSPANPVTFSDVSSADLAIARAVTTTGAALKDVDFVSPSLIQTASVNTFNPNGDVSRAELAYSIVEALGLHDYAMALSTNNHVTVTIDGDEIILDDEANIPSQYKGHVQAAINLNLINLSFSLTQAPFAFEPTIHASFEPNQAVTRGEFAVIITRSFDQYQTPSVIASQGSIEDNEMADEMIQTNMDLEANISTFPNPTTDVINVQFGAIGDDANGTINIVNLNGQIVQQQQVTLNEGTTTQIQVTDLPRGLYLLQINADNQKVTRKVILK